MSEVPLEQSLESRITRRAATHLRAFRQQIEQALPNRVTEVVLFGSRARGDAGRRSDYDVAVFVEAPEPNQALRYSLADQAYAHIRAGIHIRPIALSSKRLAGDSNDPLSASIRRDGVVVR